MKRRDLLLGMGSGVAFAAGNGALWQLAQNSTPATFGDEAMTLVQPTPIKPAATVFEESLPETETQLEKTQLAEAPELNDPSQLFDTHLASDRYLDKADLPMLNKVLRRLGNVQKVVGHGNFNLLDFDSMLKYARRYEAIGEFSQPELDFIEKVFFADARHYGFYGDRVTDRIAEQIAARDTFRIPATGHYIFKGKSLEYYQKLIDDVGTDIVLTSGIRSVVKQTHLFLAKCANADGNLSLASRSLAPPGHSFHGIGDFDVGRRGWGSENFTAKFAETDEFKRMQDLGYVKIRYPENNGLGVRFEPWHIMVV